MRCKLTAEEACSNNHQSMHDLSSSVVSICFASGPAMAMATRALVFGKPARLQAQFFGVRVF